MSHTEKAITLIELPPTSQGRLDGSLALDVFSKGILPPRAISLLHAIFLKEGYSNVASIAPLFNDQPGILNKGDWERLFSTDILMVSTLTRTVPQTRELVCKYKKENPNGIVVAGGIHPTFEPEECLKWADVIVRKEGEITALELLNKITKGASLKGVKGISYRENGSIIHEKDRDLLTEKEMSELPLPFYPSSFQKKKTMETIFFSRGCPYACEFCSINALYGTGQRWRSIESIIIDLEKKYSEELRIPIVFTDDNLAPTRNIGGGRKEVIPEVKMRMEEIIRAKLNTRKSLIQTDVHASQDPDFLKLSREMGSFLVHLGVESLTPETLKGYHKSATVIQIEAGVRLYREAGFWVHGMLVLGGKGDTVESLQKTLAWAKANLNSAQFFAETPFPGTKFAERMEQEDRILTRDYSLYDAQNVVIDPEGQISAYELQQIIAKMYQDFYKWPWRIPNIPRFSGNLNHMEFDRRCRKYAGELMPKILNDPQTKNHLDFLATATTSF